MAGRLVGCCCVFSKKARPAFLKNAAKNVWFGCRGIFLQRTPKETKFFLAFSFEKELLACPHRPRKPNRPLPRPAQHDVLPPARIIHSNRWSRYSRRRPPVRYKSAAVAIRPAAASNSPKSPPPPGAPATVRAIAPAASPDPGRARNGRNGSPSVQPPRPPSRSARRRTSPRRPDARSATAAMLACHAPPRPSAFSPTRHRHAGTTAARQSPVDGFILCVANVFGHPRLGARQRIARQQRRRGPAFLDVLKDHGGVEDRRDPFGSSTSTPQRGLAAANAVSRRPVPKSSGSMRSKATPFSRNAIFTLRA